MLATKMFAFFVYQSDTNELDLTLYAKTTTQTSKICKKLAISCANVYNLTLCSFNLN